jgi:ferritin-like metal-binding protein YciE
MAKRDNESLQKEFEHELKDMLDAEQRLVEALPKMAKAAKNDQLRQAFETHLRQTEGHVDRLTSILESLDCEVKAVRCDGIRGIIAEGEKQISQNEKSAARDAAIIGAAQKAEHYEIASYGTLCTWAKDLGYDDLIGPLQMTLGEEKEADMLLTRIAESRVNPTAI